MIQTITNEEISSRSVSSLPTMPNSSPNSIGGGYSSKELKAAFDSLSLLIISKYNALINAITSVGEDSLAGAIPTGFDENHTLNSFFEDVANGNLASYMRVGESTLAEELAYIHSRLDEIK